MSVIVFLYHVSKYSGYGECLRTYLEELKGHIALGLSVHPSIRPCVRSKFIKIQF